jgi:hypothetical protein
MQVFAIDFGEHGAEPVTASISCLRITTVCEELLTPKHHVVPG